MFHEKLGNCLLILFRRNKGGKMKKMYFYFLKKPAFHIYQDSEIIEVSLFIFNFIIEK